MCLKNAFKFLKIDFFPFYRPRNGSSTIFLDAQCRNLSAQHFSHLYPFPTALKFCLFKRCLPIWTIFCFNILTENRCRHVLLATAVGDDQFLGLWANRVCLWRIICDGIANTAKLFHHIQLRLIQLSRWVNLFFTAPKTSPTCQLTSPIGASKSHIPHGRINFSPPRNWRKRKIAFVTFEPL